MGGQFLPSREPEQNYFSPRAVLKGLTENSVLRNARLVGKFPNIDVIAGHHQKAMQSVVQTRRAPRRVSARHAEARATSHWIISRSLGGTRGPTINRNLSFGGCAIRVAREIQFLFEHAQCAVLCGREVRLELRFARAFAR